MSSIMHSPGPLPQVRRRGHDGPGGGGSSVADALAEPDLEELQL